MTTVTAKHRNAVPPHVELDLPLLPVGYEWRITPPLYPEPGYLRIVIVKVHRLFGVSTKGSALYEADNMQSLKGAAERAEREAFPKAVQPHPHIGTYARPIRV